MSGRGSERIGGGWVGFFEAGSQLNDLNKKVAGLLQAQDESAFVQVDLPSIDTSFTPIFTPFKWGWAVTLAVFIPGFTQKLIMHLVNADEVVDEASYYNVVKEKAKQISDTAREAQRDEIRFDTTPLESGATFHVVDLIAFDANQIGHINPEGGPDYSGYPGNVLFTFTTPLSLANAPGKPSLARIIRNEIQTTEDGIIPSIAVRVFADDAETLTFGQQVTDHVQCKFEDDADSDITPKRAIGIDDPTDTFVDVEVGDLFTLGRKYLWIHNLAWSGEDNAIATPASPVSFIAGGFADPSDLTDLTLVGFTSETTDDPATIRITMTLNQPDPAFRLRNFTAKRKVSGRPDADYDLPKNLVVQREALTDPIYNVPGDIDIEFPMSVNPAKTYVVKVTVRTVGGFSKDFTSGDIAGSGVTVAAQVSAQGGGPSLVIGGSLQASIEDDNNAADGSGVAGDAIYPMRLWETVSNGGTKIDNKAPSGGGSYDADGVRWDDTNARLQCASNIVTLGGKPAAKLGKPFQDGDVAVLCPTFLADSADVTVDVTFALVDQGSGDMATATASSLVIPHTGDGLRGMWILEITGYAGTGKQWIELRFGSNPGQTVYTWNWQLEKGEVYRDFKINDIDQFVLDYLDETPINTTQPGSGVVTEDFQGNLYSRAGTKAGPIYLE